MCCSLHDLTHLIQIMYTSHHCLSYFKVSHIISMKLKMVRSYCCGDAVQTNQNQNNTDNNKSKRVHCARLVTWHRCHREMKGNFKDLLDPVPVSAIIVSLIRSGRVQLPDCLIPGDKVTLDLIMWCVIINSIPHFEKYKHVFLFVKWLKV